MVDYTKYFEIFDKINDFYESYHVKYSFIQSFYNFFIPGQRYLFKCKLFFEQFFIVDLSNEIGREVFINGCFEKETTNYLFNNIKPGDVFIDGGAAEGYYSFIASYKMAGQGQIIAFEPNPSIAEVFQINNGANPLISLHTLALTGDGRDVDLQFYGRNLSPYSTISSFPRFTENHITKTIIKTKSIRLDEVLKRYVPPRNPNQNLWIKLDLEGAELEVLQSSMDEIISRKAIVIVETGFYEDKSRELLTFLSTYPLTLYSLSLYETCRIENIADFDCRKVQNILFTVT